MIPVLFKEDEQIFSHNGIGALYESLSCDIWETENGSFTMELEYPVDGELFSELEDYRIIQAKPNDIDEPHNFRIYEIDKSIDELTVYVRANTITNDLGSNLITSYVARDQTPQQAMDGAKVKLIEPTNFDLISDIQTQSSTEWTRINPLNAIVGARGSLVDIWGGEIKRTNNAIYLYSRRGKDKVATIRPGKNIEGLTMTVSTAGIVTKVLPTYTYRPTEIPKYQMVTLSDGTREKRRVHNTGDTRIQEDITVLGDVVTSQYVDNYPMNHWRSVDYNDDENLRETINNFVNYRLDQAEESSTIIDNSNFPDELKSFVKTELDKRAKQYFTHRNPGVDQPTVRISVNMLQLADSPEWEEFKDLERIGLTDTVEVWVEEYDIDVDVRVTELQYDSLGERVKKFTAGSDRAPRQSIQEKQYADLTKSLNDYKTTVENGVNNIMRNTADGLNRKFEGYTEPPAELSSEGDIWFKEIGEGKTEIWIHDGVYWQPLMTEDFVEQLVMDIAATQEELEEAKQQAKLDADQALADAIAHADAEDARIRGELESEVGGAIELAEQAKQDAIDKANQALVDAKAHAEAEDARIKQEIGLEVDGAIVLAEQAKQDAIDKANQALADAKAHADAEIALIGTHFDGIIEGVESDVADAKQTADDAIYKIDNDIANKFTSLDAEVLAIETISNSAQTNAQTALNQSVDALGDASTALTNAQTALNRADTAIGSASDAATLAGNALTKADEAQDAATILSGQVSGFETTVAGFNQTVNNYEGQVSGFRNDILGLESTVASYESEVDEFGNTVSTYATEVSTMRNTVIGFESTVATYGTEVSDLAGEVLGYKNQVSTFNNTVAGFNSTVVNYTTEVDEFGTQVGSYATEVSTLTNTVSGFQSKVTKVEQDYEDVSGTVATHTSQISNLDGEIALKANTTTVNALTGRVTTAETGITANATAIGLKANTTTVNALTGRVSTAETNITANADAIKLKASTTSVNTLTGRVSTAETNITANADAIKLKASTTSVNTLTGRVSTAESDITANATAISQRLTTTEVNTLVDGKGYAKESSVSTRFNDIQSTVDGTTQTIATLRTDVDGKATTAQFNTLTSTVNGTIQRVGNAEGKITTIETNVSGLQTTVASKASQSEVTQLATGLSSVVTDLSNLDIGGRNLYRMNSSARNRENFDVYKDSPSSFYIHHSWSGYSLRMLVDEKQEVTISLWAKLKNGSPEFIIFHPIQYNAEAGGSRTTAPSINKYLNGEEWTYLTHTFTPAPNTKSMELHLITSPRDSGNEVWISGVKIEKGNKATDWTPAPEDTQSQITQNANNINLRVKEGEVLSQINIEANQTLIQSNKLVLDASSVIFTGSAFIPSAQIASIDAAKITAGTISTARLNTSAIVTAGLTANVIKSTHIETSTATINKIFATDAMVNTLTAKTAFISSVKAVDIDAARITSGTINAARLNASAIVTAGLTANVVKSTHIETSTATIDKIFATDAMVNRLTAKTAFITSVRAVNIDAARITSGTISAARLNASAIVTAGLTANVVKATHISADTALFDMLFATTAATTRLVARGAWITTANIADAAITNAKIATGTIQSAKIASLDVSKINGNIAQFIRAGFATATGDTVSVDGSGIAMNRADGSMSSRLAANGYEFWRDGAEHGTMGVRAYSGLIPEFVGRRSVSLYVRNQSYISLTYQGDRAYGSEGHIALSVLGDTGNVSIHRPLSMNAQINMGESHIVNVPRITSTQDLVLAAWNKLFRIGSESIEIQHSIRHNGDLELLARGSRAILIGTDQIQFSRELNILGYRIRNSNSSNMEIYSSQDIRLSTWGSRAILIGSAGIVFSRPLNMNGNAITNQSDERLKRDIKTSEMSSLESIKSWRFVGFNWKDEEMNNRLGRQFGVIAQETPELAIYDVETDSWSIDSSKQIMMNSHAIHQLSLMEENTNQVASQALQLGESNKSEIDELREENKELRNRIEELEGVV